MQDQEVWRRLYISQLEARLILSEMRRIQLNVEIDSPHTTKERRAKAILLRQQVMVEWGTTMTELEDQRALVDAGT